MNNPATHQMLYLLLITLLLLFGCRVISDSLRPHRRQHTTLPCPSPSPGVCSHTCDAIQFSNTTTFVRSTNSIFLWCSSGPSQGLKKFVFPSLFPCVLVLISPFFLYRIHFVCSCVYHTKFFFCLICFNPLSSIPCVFFISVNVKCFFIYQDFS